MEARYISMDCDKNKESFNCIDCSKLFFSKYNLECHLKTKLHIEKLDVNKINCDSVKKLYNCVNWCSIFF